MSVYSERALNNLNNSNGLNYPNRAQKYKNRVRGALKLKCIFDKLNFNWISSRRDALTGKYISHVSIVVDFLIPPSGRLKLFYSQF